MFLIPSHSLTAPSAHPDERVWGQDPTTVPLRRTIPVLDVNDNRPTFHGTPYRWVLRRN